MPTKNDPRPRRRATLAQRLISHLRTDGECWVYDGARNHGNYPIIWVSRGKVARAHRVAYELFVGPIPAGMHIDHVQDRGCKSRACCRPSHLEPTTQAENNRRAAAHRRARLAADLAEMVAAA